VANPEGRPRRWTLGELAILDGHDDLVGDVLSHEVAFWDMAVV
jgi:hypothetical protein